LVTNRKYLGRTTPRAWIHDLELGFVIGLSGKDLTPEQAKASMFGVTIFNDFSARDIQLQEMMAY
jgi:2-keto-4-pentenoate hydratase/2-oxohepta-3-ene-1,7-dioic acid hydratase in catechol pathway